MDPITMQYFFLTLLGVLALGDLMLIVALIELGHGHGAKALLIFVLVILFAPSNGAE